MEFRHEPTRHVDLTFAPIRAEAKEHSEVTGVGNRWVTDILPEIRVTGVVKVRGIDYAVNVEFKWERYERSAWRKGVELGTTHWQEIQHGYKEGFRRVSSGAKVSFMSPTYYVISDAVSEGLDWVEANHPEWRHESLRLRLEAVATRATGKVSEARAALSKALEEETAATEALTAHVQLVARVG